MYTLTDNGLYVSISDGTETNHWFKSLSRPRLLGDRVSIISYNKLPKESKGYPIAEDFDYILPTTLSEQAFDYSEISVPSVSSNIELFDWLNTKWNTIPSSGGGINIHTKTFAQFTTLASGNGLIVGDFYKITDATKSTNAANVPNGIPLIVQAVTTSTADFNALSPDYAEDVIEYNSVTDIILFRWDTIYDHSQYADWRNGLGVTFTNGVAALKSHFGKACIGILGCMPENVNVGSATQLNIAAVNVIYGLTIGTGCNITSTDTDVCQNQTIGNYTNLSCVKLGNEDNDSRNYIGNGCNISVVGDIIGSSIGNGCNIGLDGGDIIYAFIPNTCNISLSGQSIINSVLTPSYDISTGSDVLTSMNTNRNLCVQYATPTAGSTITINYQTNALLLKPSGTLATLTINLPDATDVKEGYKVTMSSTQIVTALTLNAPNASFPTTVISSLAVGVPVSYVYINQGGNSFWFKC